MYFFSAVSGALGSLTSAGTNVLLKNENARIASEKQQVGDKFIRGMSIIASGAFMRAAASNGEIFTVHFRGHTDNIRGLKYYPGNLMRNKLKFRENSKSYSRAKPPSKRSPVLNIFNLF